MALAPFFERVYGALGGHLAISRESLTSALENVIVGIRCGDEINENDLWIAELATNLMARLYPRLAITAPDPQRSTLCDLALKINPNIDIENEAPGATSICVGSATAKGAIFPGASGWVARIIHKSSRRVGPENPYSAGAAASLACAELFRRIFLKCTSEPDFSISLLNFDKKTGANLDVKIGNIGEVLFVGAGAVGNAALWALGRDNSIRGRISLVDPEVVTLFNLQRYVLATYTDIGTSKVLLGKQALSDTKLSVDMHELTLDSFAEAQSPIKYPTIAVSVDNIDGRRSAQALLPRLVVNGWTGDQALGASWHEFSRNAACLACLYHPHGQGPSAIEQAAKALGLSHERTALLWVTHQPLSDADIHAAATTLGVKESALTPWRGKSLGNLYTDVVCGAVPLDVTGVGKVETVPLAHQSALAGILMAVELVKRTRPTLAKLGQVEPLVSWDDVLRPPPPIWKKPRAREPGCICGDEIYQAVYHKKWHSKISPK